jgi:hypothetical protein
VRRCCTCAPLVPETVGSATKCRLGGVNKPDKPVCQTSPLEVQTSPSPLHVTWQITSNITKTTPDATLNTRHACQRYAQALASDGRSSCTAHIKTSTLKRTPTRTPPAQTKPILVAATSHPNTSSTSSATSRQLPCRCTQKLLHRLFTLCKTARDSLRNAADVVLRGVDTHSNNHQQAQQHTKQR